MTRTRAAKRADRVEQPSGFRGGADCDGRSGTVKYGAERRELRYAAYGDPDGDPVVVLHGTPGSRLLGALFDGIGRESGRRIVAPDRPGFGRSAAWTGRRPTDAGTWFDALLSGADVSSAPVAAFSGGSADALGLAATHGELVDRLDLVAAAAPPSIARDTPRLQRALGRAAVRTPRLLATGLRGQAWLAARGPPSVVVGQYTDQPDEIPPDVAELVRKDFVESCARTRNGVVAELAWAVESWGFPLSAVDCPVTLWHGERDGNAPISDARRLSDRLPDAELRALDADHLTSLLACPSRVVGRTDSGD